MEMALSIVLGHLRFNDAVSRFKDKPGESKLPPRPKKPTDSALGKLSLLKRRLVKKQYLRECADYKMQVSAVRTARARAKQGKPIADEFRCAKQFISDQRNKLLYSG